MTRISVTRRWDTRAMSVLTPSDQSDGYLTVAEVAAELRCSEPTIRRRIRAGELPAVKLGTGRNSSIRIPRAALDAWLFSAPQEAA